MADLGTVRPDSTGTPYAVTGLSGGFTNPGTSPADIADASDATYVYDTNNGTFTYGEGYACGVNWPDDISNIDTLTVHVRYQADSTNANLTWDDIGIRVLQGDGGTVMAAASSGGTFPSVVNPAEDTSVHEASYSFDTSGYLNTGAAQSGWDASTVEIALSYTRTKGGATIQHRILDVWFTGTYTASAPSTNAPAENAAGTGAANNATAAIGANAGLPQTGSGSTVAQSTFSGSATGGWDTPETGGAFEYLESGATWNEGSGAGTLAFSASAQGYAYLTSMSAQTDSVTSILFSVNTDTNFTYVVVAARVSGWTGTGHGLDNEEGYWLAANMENTGAIGLTITKRTAGSEGSLTTGGGYTGVYSAGTYVANDQYWLELTISGTSLEGRVWKDGDARPSSAQITGSDSDYSSGVAGAGAYNGGAGTKTISYWDLIETTGGGTTDPYGTAHDATVIYGSAPDAGLASGTGTAHDATVTTSGSASPDAELASGTGTAYNATPTTTVDVDAGHAAGTGAAYDATVDTVVETNAPAELATGTGAAQDATAAIGASAEVSAGTGTAHDASGGVATDAEVASASGNAYDASTAHTVDPTNAAGTGAASDPTTAITVTAELASGAGTAHDATVSTVPAVNAPAEVASGTGAAYDATPTTTVNVDAGHAAGTGAAYDATVSTSEAVNANAGLASGTGVASDATTAISASAGQAAGTGAANDASTAIGASAEVAAGTGAANDATAAITTTSGVATGTGTAHDPTVSLASQANAPAGLAAGTGTAHDATVTATTNAQAGAAAGSGAAYDASTAITVAGEAAAGTGVAHDATVTRTAEPSAGVAAATGAAHNPSVAIAVYAGVATGTGAAWDVTVAPTVFPAIFMDRAASANTMYESPTMTPSAGHRTGRR